MNTNQPTQLKTGPTHASMSSGQSTRVPISQPLRNFTLFDRLRNLPKSDWDDAVKRLLKYYCGKNVAGHSVGSIIRVVADRRTDDDDIMALLQTMKMSSHKLKRSSKINNPWRAQPKHRHPPHVPRKNALDKRLQDACCGGRESSRVRDVLHILDRITNPKPCYVDIGCGDGKITSAIAVAISSTRTIGCDIENKINSDSPVEYIQSTETSIPGVKSGIAHLLTMFMSMHHFKYLSAMLDEVKRIAAPGAIIIIREHDATTESAKWFYDFTHAFYECMVPGSKKKIGEFMDTFEAFYRSADEWVELMVEHGFTPITKPFLPSIDGKPVHDKADSVYLAFKLG